MLLLLIVFVVGVILGSIWSPAIVLKDRTFYFDYSAKRGTRNRQKIYSFK